MVKAKAVAVEVSGRSDSPGSDRVAVRFGRKLKAASAKAAKAAGCATLGEWLRGLAETATGVEAPMPRGMAGFSKRDLAKVGRIGRASRWARFELLKMGATYNELREVWTYCGVEHGAGAIDALKSIRAS